jgi:hypothetical protein
MNRKQEDWERDDASSMTMTPRHTFGTYKASPYQGILTPNQNNEMFIHRPPSLSHKALTQTRYRHPKSFWATCGSGAGNVVEETPRLPYGFACGLIQEEAELLSKQKCQPTKKDFDQQKLEQPVHADWLELKHKQQPSNLMHLNAELGLIVGDEYSQRSCQSPRQPTEVKKSTNGASMCQSENEPRYSPITSQSNPKLHLPMPPTPPGKPSEKEVRMLLKKVKQERRMKSMSKTGAGVAVSLSPKVKSISRPKVKLEPEEVRTDDGRKESVMTTQSGMQQEPPAPEEELPPSPRAMKNSGKEIAAIEAARETSREKRPKHAMVLTRKTTAAANNMLESMKCLPDKKDEVRHHAMHAPTSTKIPSSNLWDATRRQRYETFKGRVQHSLPPTMKISPSMQVETSSSAGSFFSEITGDESHQKVPINTRGSNHKSSVAYASSPKSRLLVKERKAAEGYQHPYCHPPQFLQSSHEPTRTGFWGSRDRIEESRDGCEDEETEDSAGNNGRELRESLHSKNLDRIESMRGSPTKEIGRLLGIPSLDSQKSSESFLELRVRSIQSSQWEATKQESMSEYGQEDMTTPNQENQIQKLHKCCGVQETKNRRRSYPQSYQREPHKSTVNRISGSPKLDQRTVRLLYADQFAKMVRVHSLHHVDKILSENTVEKIAHTGAQTGLSFVIRKRPLLPQEVKSGDFDVVEAPSAHPDAVVLYEASILPDRKTRDLKAHLFRFDAVFSEKSTDEDFYVRMGQPYILHAKSGGFGTFILTGGNESGKSRLLSYIEERAAFELFADSSREASKVSMRCLELHGAQCTDLLGPIGTSVRFVKTNGVFEVKGAVEAAVSSAQQMIEVIEAARNRSITQNIIRHGDIYSYLIHQIFVENIEGRGCLTFIECPGEDQDPASPLSFLMHDITTTASHQSTATRCNLSKVLSPAIQSQNSETCVIGTVSPVSVDTETSLSTLVSIKSLMKKLISRGNDKSRTSDNASSDETLSMPKQWSQAKLLDWMRKKNYLTPDLEKRLCIADGQLSGRVVMRMPKMELQNTFFSGLKDGERRSEKLFIGLRAENDRASRHRVKQRRARQRSGE